jgi:hypothetical protein
VAPEPSTCDTTRPVRASREYVTPASDTRIIPFHGAACAGVGTTNWASTTPATVSSAGASLRFMSSSRDESHRRSTMAANGNTAWIITRTSHPNT